MNSTAVNSASLPSNLRWTRPRSQDSLHSLEHARKPSENIVSLKQQIARPVAEVSKSEQVSRLELLLLAKKEKPTYLPDQETDVSQQLNQAIKACAQWTDIQQIFSGASDLSASNLAFAFYRLGSLTAFASKKRIADMKASNLVDQIFKQAMLKLDDMDASSLVLLLDGCARLQHRPSTDDLSQIAWSVHQNVYQMFARQLPIVLWSFATLGFTPGPDVLFSLEDAVNRQVSELSPQGMALVFSGFHAANHHMTQITLGHLADTMQRKLLLFKPSELSTCLKALTAQGYTPTPAFIEAIAKRTGKVMEQRSNSMKPDKLETAGQVLLK